MAQHLWFGLRRVRFCEACRTLQFYEAGEWSPPRGPICFGDHDGGGGRRRPVPRPSAPSENPKILEMA
jgi:hypothetical protein